MVILRILSGDSFYCGNCRDIYFSGARLLIIEEASQGYSAWRRLRRLNSTRPQDAAFAGKADVRFFRNQLLSVVDKWVFLEYNIISFL
jgi:hypothetical protein